MNISNFKNIAIVQLNHIGDMVCTLPLVKYVRQNAPTAKITVFLGAKNACLAPFIPCDQVVCTDIHTTRPGSKYIPIFHYGLKFRHKFDLVICAIEPRKSLHIFLKLLDPKLAIAYVENDWHGKIMNGGVLHDRTLQRTRHNTLEVLNIIASYQELPEDLLPEILICEEIRVKYIKRLQKQLSSLLQNKLILVSVTNNRPNSTIAVHDYANYLNELAKTHKFSIVISYMEKDARRANELAKLLNAPHLSLLTNDFNEFMILLDLVDLCFVGDGGIMNLAMALQKPLLALFGKISAIEWRPLHKLGYYLRHEEHVKYIPKDEIVQKLKEILDKLY